MDKSTDSRHQNFRWFAPAILSSLLLVACGGGGSDLGGVDTSLNDNSVSPIISGTEIDPFPNVSLNGSSTGRLLISGESSYLDLETGERVQLSGDSVAASRDGNTIVEHYEQYRFVPGGGCNSFAIHNELVAFRDATTGFLIDSFEVQEDIQGNLHLSPDGLSVAAFWRPALRCSDNDTAMTVFSRNGDVLLRGDGEINSFDWLPNNLLVMAYGQTIGVQLSRGSLAFNPIANMTNVPGTPSRLAVSPDGTQVLFEMVTDGSLFFSGIRRRNATVWAVNTDGTNLRQLATTSRERQSDLDLDDPQVNMPFWSPDGSTINLTEDYTTGGQAFVDDNLVVVDVISFDTGGLSYMVPATSAPLQLPPANFSATGVRPVFQKGLDGQISVTGLDPFSTTRWLPALERAPVVAGSLPAPNGLMNRGLSNTLYYLTARINEPARLTSLDLATGIETTEVTYTDEDISDDTVAISTGATRTALYIRESFDNTNLRVYDASGTTIFDFPLITNSYHFDVETFPQFSPVNDNLIAWIYDDDDFGTSAIAVDISTGQYTTAGNLQDYDQIAWTKEGNLLVFDEGQVYQSVVSDGAFGALSLLFELNDVMEDPTVNPITNEIAYSAGGQIFVVSIDGTNLRRVVSNSADPVVRPEWSTDGQYLSVLMDEVAYVVAADALNVRLYKDGNSMGGFEVTANERLRFIESNYKWR